MNSEKSPKPGRVILDITRILLLLLLACAPGAARETGKLPIRISENGRYFVDHEGKPFFWLGDTQWELFHQFTVADAKELLLARKNQGFNAVQVMVTGIPYRPGKRNMVPLEPGKQAWLNLNPLTPDERYFERADAIISYAESIDMLIVLGVFHGRDGDNEVINIENVRPWAKWLASRYRPAKNIVWSMFPHAVEASRPLVRAAVDGLQAGDGRHLITMHPDPNSRSSSFMHPEPWLSFNTLQTHKPSFLNYEMVTADYEKPPVKPVIDGEAMYEGEGKTPITAFEARRAGYWACLAGGFYSYGHGGNWQSSQTWRTWIGSPGAGQMTVLGDLFRSIEWWRLVPDQSLFLVGKEGNAAARSDKGDWMMAYITGRDPVTLRLNAITAAGKATVFQIDPLNGKRTSLGTVPTAKDFSFQLDGEREDAVLLFVGG